jgi:hypothetical protein
MSDPELRKGKRGALGRQVPKRSARDFSWSDPDGESPLWKEADLLDDPAIGQAGRRAPVAISRVEG